MATTQRDVGDRLTAPRGVDNRGLTPRVQRAVLAIDRVTGNAAGLLELSAGEPIVFRVVQSRELAGLADGSYALTASASEISIAQGARVVFRGEVRWTDPRALAIFAGAAVHTQVIVSALESPSDEKSYTFAPNLDAFALTPALRPVFASIVAQYSTWPATLDANEFTVAQLEQQMSQSADLRGLAVLFTQMWTEYQAAGGRRVEDFSLLARQALRQWSYENATFRANRLMVTRGYDGLGLYRRDGYPFAIYDAHGLQLLGIGGAPRDPYYVTDRPRDAIHIRLPEGRATEVLGVLQQLLVDQPLEDMQAIVALMQHRELVIREVKRDWDYGAALRQEVESMIPVLIGFWIAEASADFLILRGNALMKVAGVQLKAAATALGLIFNFAYFGQCAVALVRVGYYLTQVRLNERGEPATAPDQYALRQAALSLRVLLVAYAVLLGTSAASKGASKLKALFFSFPLGPGGGPTAFATNEGFVFRMPSEGRGGTSAPARPEASAMAVPVSQQGGGEQSKPAPEAKTDDAPTEQKTDAPAEQKTEQTEEPKKEETEGEHTDDQTGRQLEEQQRKELDEIPRQANEARSKPNQTLRTWLRAVLERYIAERKEDKDFSDGQANALRARLEEVLAMSTFALLREIGLAETFNRMFTYYRDLVDAYDRGIEFHTESEAITGSESTERQEFEAAREQAQRTLDALTEFATDEGEGAAAEAEAGEGQTTAANPPPARRPQRAGTVGNKKLDHAQAFFGAKPKMSHLDSTQAIGWDFHTLKSIFYREAMRLALPPEWSVSGYESNGPITIEVPTIEQFMRLIDAMMNGTTQSELELLLERFSPREEGD